MMPESLADPLRNVPILTLDAWPVMEWLKAKEPVASRFDELLDTARTGSVRLILSSINLGEIYYNCCNEWNQDRADAVMLEFESFPIHIFHPSQEDVLAAARIKGKYKCSYADAFATVLAYEFGCSVVTGDEDFLKIERGGMIRVDWWGK